MITLWHNPRCSKSRQTLALIEAAGAEVTIRLYLQDPPSVDEISLVRTALGDVALVKMMRSGDKQFKELGLSEDMPEAALLTAMAENPTLIERPIAIKQGRAIIGRPPEAIEAML